MTDRKEQLARAQQRFHEKKKCGSKKVQAYLTEPLTEELHKIKKENGLKNISETIRYLIIENRVQEKLKK